MESVVVFRYDVKSQVEKAVHIVMEAKYASVLADYKSGKITLEEVPEAFLGRLMDDIKESE